MEKVYGIIVSYNPEIDVLTKCVDSLYKQLEKIIIVDNTPQGFKELEQLKSFPNVEIIYLYDNYGIAYAQNVGLRKVLEEKADYILFSDDDTIYPANFIKEMLQCFEDKKVFLCGPLGLNVLSSKFIPFVKKTAIGFRNFIPDRGKHQVFQLNSSGTIARSEYIPDVGLLNEDLFIDWVDYEWCWRSIKKGYKVIGNADVVVYHRLGDGNRKIGFLELTERSLFRHYHIVRNAVYLSLKSDVLDPIHRITLFLSAILYILNYSCFMKPHLAHLKYTLNGLFDGLLGKLGKLDYKY